jgi:predicted O-methyltransferase YrrM
MEATWSDVDDWFASRLQGNDAVLDAALADSASAGLPAISVTPLQGKLLALLVRMAGARRILEIGTLGGYSAIWMARAVPPNGELVTLEIEPKHAAVAQRNIERAKLGGRVRVVTAPAASTLAAMIADRVPPFDFIFIDADKQRSDAYLRASLELSRVGTVIVVDNVVREGKVTDAATTDDSVKGIQRMTDLIAADPRLSATAIQTVGGKGYDGFVVAVVGAAPGATPPGARAVSR